MDETLLLDTIPMDMSTLPTRKKIIFFIHWVLTFPLGNPILVTWQSSHAFTRGDKTMSIEATAKRLEEIRAQIKTLQTEERECKEYLFEQAPEWFANPSDGVADFLVDGDVTVTLTWGWVSECTRKGHFQKRVEVESAA